ncbi:MAG: serine hydrolase domain-containing protein, partial [Bryobacteraceae bacterium]
MLGLLVSLAPFQHIEGQRSRTGTVTAEQSPWLDAAKQAEVNRIFAQYAKKDSPGYVLGLIKDGELVFAKGYGQANLDDNVAITPQTAFHLASLSKQFTAAAIALLILEGKLSLVDPVSKYVPED